jgi:hypothetical protein
MDKKLKLVEVIWWDSTWHTDVSLDSILTSKNLKEDFGTKRMCGGYLVKKDKTAVIIAHDMTFEDKDAEFTIIPFAMVEEINYVG